jgi:hypothetical protein
LRATASLHPRPGDAGIAPHGAARDDRLTLARIPRRGLGPLPKTRPHHRDQTAPSRPVLAMAVEHLSLSTTPVYLLRGGRVLSQGTGFYFARPEGPGAHMLFLVTNYHVVTGLPPGDHAPALGDSIEFYFHQSEAQLSDLRTVRLPLFARDGQRTWLTSRSTPEADLALIPVPAPMYRGCPAHCITAESHVQSKLRVVPTSNVTLIGYPYGYYDRANSLPVWKTGSVASEPAIDFDGKPLILIDISAFPGMSGSPAFAVANGTYAGEDGNTYMGSPRRFLGIYASMQMRRERRYLEELPNASRLGITTAESLQLGHVWKARLITELIDEFDLAAYDRDIWPQLV